MERTDKVQPRHEEWLAPSWSWLSVDSPVEVDLEHRTRFMVSATVVDYFVEAVHFGKLFGRLKGGAITIKGAVNDASEDDICSIVDEQSEASSASGELMLDAPAVMSSSHYPEYTFLTIGSIERSPRSSPSTSFDENTTSSLRSFIRPRRIALGLIFEPNR